MSERKKMRRAFVSLPDGVWDIIDNELRGNLGEGDSEIIRNIVISYLSDQGYFINKKGERGYEVISDLTDKVTIIEKIISVLTNLLEENNTISGHELENLIRKEIAKPDNK